MLQVKKKDIELKILKCAEKLFMEKSYSSASMDEIASCSGLSRGALYTYFSGKEELFSKLCEPAISIIDSCMFKNIHECELPFYSEEVTIKQFGFYSDKLFEEYTSFKLLFFSSAGSKYENFRESLIRKYEEGFRSFLEYDKKFKPAFEGESGEMIIHTFAATYISFTEELLLHYPSEEEKSIYITKMAMIIHSAIKRLLKEVL